MRDLCVGKYGFSNWATLAKVTKASDLVPSCD